MSNIGALLMLAGSVISAAAPTPSGDRKVTVRFNDLDLARADHVALLNRRIVTAVNRACAGDARLTLEEMTRRTACETVAREQAFASANIAVAAAEARGTSLAAR